MSECERIRTRDGVALSVRPIRPSDRELLARYVEGLSVATRYRRFLGPTQRLTDRELTGLTVLDHHAREALVALDDAGELIGVARYIELDDEPGMAEVAIVIADRWQHRGVGTALLSRLIGRASAEGIHTFAASCLADNAEVIALFRELGEAVRRTGGGGGAVELEISLPPASTNPPAQP